MELSRNSVGFFSPSQILVGAATLRQKLPIKHIVLASKITLTWVYPVISLNIILDVWHRGQ